MVLLTAPAPHLALPSVFMGSAPKTIPILQEFQAPILKTCYFALIQYIYNMVKLMNQVDFAAKIKAKKLLVFSKRDIQALFGISSSAATMAMHRYSQKGYILRLKKGLYVFPDALPPDLYLANKLYSPSYISREFALSYHGIIPETVYEITSVTTKATRRFEKLGKIYSYRRIRREAFTGYAIEKQRGLNFLIADPEKAFVDTLYYRVIFGIKPISRFNKDKINLKRALTYATLFNNKKLVGMLKRTLA